MVWKKITVAEKDSAISFGMLNDRRSFRRFPVFVFYVRRDARELNVRFVIRCCGKYLVRIDLD